MIEYDLVDKVDEIWRKQKAQLIKEVYSGGREAGEDADEDMLKALEDDMDEDDELDEEEVTEAPKKKKQKKSDAKATGAVGTAAGADDQKKRSQKGEESAKQLLIARNFPTRYCNNYACFKRCKGTRSKLTARGGAFS